MSALQSACTRVAVGRMITRPYWYVALRFVSQVVLGFIMGRDPDTGTVLTYSFQDGNQVCVSHMLPDVALVPPR